MDSTSVNGRLEGMRQERLVQAGPAQGEGLGGGGGEERPHFLNKIK